MKGPKIVVIGAGSYFFGRPVIWNMVNSPILREGTLALVDTDPAVLKTMKKVAENVFRETKSPAGLMASTDRREVLKDADFVITTFSHRNAHYRGVDTEISARHGVRMCSSDTIGPGGVFRALREIPTVLSVARDVRELAPHAWLINFINPTSVLGIALMRHAPDVRSFALCDGNHEPHSRLMYLQMAGVLPMDATEIPPEVERKTDLAIGGVNHCTWIVRFNYDGKDVLPALRERVAKEAAADKGSEKAKPRFNSKYALQLMDLYGAYPTAVSHTKEYVPFFQGYGAAPNQPEPIRLFDAKNRAEEMAEAWKTNELYASGGLSASHFMENHGRDHATDIVENMWGGLGKPFFINSPNRGAVSNMASDAFLELRCDVDIHGVRPRPFGEMPRGLLAMQQQVLDTHELTAEAAVTFDKKTLLKALATDPIVNNLEDARNVMNDLLEAEREALPAEWYK